MCLAQGHNAVTPVRLEPAAPLSHVHLNKQGYEENYPCADPEGAGAPGPAKSQSYRIYLAILVWIHLKISKASQNSMLGH